MVSFDWLVLIDWLIRLKLDVQGQASGKILDADGQGGWGVLQIGQFSWMSYVEEIIFSLKAWWCVTLFFRDLLYSDLAFKCAFWYFGLGYKVV